MAQVNVQWPSEDEDFDATSETTATATMEKPAENNESTTPVTAQSGGDLTASTAAVEAPEAPAQATVGDTEEETAAPKAEDKPSSETPKPEADGPTSPKPPAAVVSSHGRNYGRLALEVVLAAAVVALGLYAWTLHGDNNNLKKQLASANQNPQAIIQKQTDALIAKVGALMQLPQGEQPTVANVTDADAAKKQSAFFNDAQNGDKVLMYVKAGQAILYRPSTNKIIKVAPLTLTNSTTPTTSSTTTTPKTSR